MYPYEARADRGQVESTQPEATNESGKRPDHNRVVFLPFLSQTTEYIFKGPKTKVGS